MMTNVIAASPSLILRATHILIVRVNTPRPTPWQTADGWLVRSVDLVATVQEVLKAPEGAPLTGPSRLRVTQYANPSPLQMPIPGAWSEAPVEPGASVLVFSVAEPSADLATVLVEPACQRVLPSEVAPMGVRLAMRRERRELTISEFLTQAVGIAPSLDAIFVDYLSAQLTNPELARIETFERLTALLETPGITTATRANLLNAVIGSVSNSPIYSDAHLNRLAVALFRVALSPIDPNLRENVLSVYLPNHIGLTGGARLRRASEVFRDLADEREEIEWAMRAHAHTPSGAKLVTWLRAD
jgi:hypothetical protein